MLHSGYCGILDGVIKGGATPLLNHGGRQSQACSRKLAEKVDVLAHPTPCKDTADEKSRKRSFKINC